MNHANSILVRLWRTTESLAKRRDAMWVSAQSAQTAGMNAGVLRDLVIYLIWTIEAEMAKNRVAELREQ